MTLASAREQASVPSPVRLLAVDEEEKSVRPRHSVPQSRRRSSRRLGRTNSRFGREAALCMESGALDSTAPTCPKSTSGSPRRPPRTGTAATDPGRADPTLCQGFANAPPGQEWVRHGAGPTLPHAIGDWDRFRRSGGGGCAPVGRADMYRGRGPQVHLGMGSAVAPGEYYAGGDGGMAG
jgi:hypothetical protein